MPDVMFMYSICNYENIVNLEDTMAKTAIIQTRVEPAVKQNAQKILNALNISMSEAISILSWMKICNRNGR